MIDEKRPCMLQTTIHHDNALSHRAAQTMETIKILGIELFGPPLLNRLGPLFSISMDQECFERYPI